MLPFCPEIPVAGFLMGQNQSKIVDF